MCFMHLLDDRDLLIPILHWQHDPYVLRRDDGTLRSLQGTIGGRLGVLITVAAVLHLSLT